MTEPSLEKRITDRNLKLTIEELEEMDGQKFCMEAYKKKTYCGTQFCILGYLFYYSMRENLFPSLVEKRIIFEAQRIEVYSKRIFPATATKKKDWEFLFGADWAVYDNTIKGAIARINYWIDGNLKDGWKFSDFATGWQNEQKGKDKC